MFRLPREAQLLERFAPAFTAPSFQRFLLLSLGAIVCFGRRTVSRLLWTMRPFLQGHPSSYHRFFSMRRWSLWPLAKVLAQTVLALIPADQEVVIALDDTVDGPHRGKKVYGPGWWRDAVASTWSRVSFRRGHRWIVLCVNVKFGFASRPWALPVLVALARKQELNRQEKRRHKTPCHLARQLLAVLVHWFPQRRFLVLGDWGFGSNELACFCQRHHEHLTLIARCRGDTNLWALPRAGQRRRAKGGWQKKTHKLPSPKQAVAQATNRLVRRLPWYGNQVRELQLLSAAGAWYRNRGTQQPVSIRWVFVHNPLDEAANDYFYSTDVSMKPEQITTLYESRWPIEVTFEDVRAWLGLGSTRHRSQRSVLRIGPCLFGLFSVVSLIYAQMVRHRPAAATARQTPCYKKAEPTFSDALFAVRKLLWTQVLMHHPLWRPHVALLPKPFKRVLLEYLAEAA
jgi:hypothetical protein